MDTQPPFQEALAKLLREIFDGTTERDGFVLNPRDPGLLKQLESIDARTASTRTMPGRTTVAAHVDHVLYGIDLLNRWAGGEANPWATADWNASWTRGTVDEPAWRDLLTRLRRSAEIWQKHVAQRTEWALIDATGALASAVHTAYHLGAIRQILAAAGHAPAA